MNLVILNQEQKQAVHNILEFMLDTNVNNNRYVLTGIAGSGKTTILKEVIEQYKNTSELEKGIDDSFIPLNIIPTAMTNIACSVLCNATSHARTLHSYLKLYPNEMTCKAYPNYNDFIIIDEASMLNTALLDIVSTFKNKILFIGDKTQLPPVGLNHSPVFYQNYPTSELNHSVRQADNPLVGNYCTQLQNYIKGNCKFPKLTCNADIIHLSTDDFKDSIIQEFQTNKDSRILSLSNKTAMRYAKLISNALTNQELSVGDKVYVNSYHTKLSKQEIYTITSLQKPVDGTLGMKGYFVCLDNISKVFFTPFNTEVYKRKERNLINNLEDKNVFKDTVIDIRHTYSSTIHKAQGSTFNNVYIDLNDFKVIKDQKELARLLYVAFSRATNKVYLTGDI